jgi:hypothetical protein
VTYDFIRDSWPELMHLRDVIAEFEWSNEVGVRFLEKAATIDGDVLARHRRKAEEARFVLNQVPDPMAKLLLQELADSYERLGCADMGRRRDVDWETVRKPSARAWSRPLM